jgi:excisionase family DNA binding protein
VNNLQPGMRDLPVILRVEHLVELLGISADGVRALLRRGTLPSARVGKRVLVRREAFLAYLERGERERRPRTDSPSIEVLRALAAERRAARRRGV